jgi:hypothetical protein
MKGIKLNAGRKDGKRKLSPKIILEQYKLKPLRNDCCAVAGKAAGSVRLGLALFVTVCFKAKSKRRNNQII